ncbi:MAG: 4Fe-4S binding protein [Sphaerochaetaceae bacterium]|nr:4Fe-4S binding protein [Sphaerochaetaceae bacterium]
MEHADAKRKGLIPRLFIITLLYFLLGFVAIEFALLALACMSIPFMLLARYKQKVWCHRYCPRASLIQTFGKKRSRWRVLPPMFTDGYLRKVLLWYFGLNLMFIAGSTIRIATGDMAPMPYVRLFIAIPLWPLPQLLHIGSPDWLIHLSYRFYSMMLSSTILGVVAAMIWRPRAWCAVCPVGNLSNRLLRHHT